MERGRSLERDPEEDVLKRGGGLASGTLCGGGEEGGGPTSKGGILREEVHLFPASADKKGGGEFALYLNPK